VKCVGRLKYHGGVEGLETHCVIIAPGNWINQTKNAIAVEGGSLHRELLSIAHTNIREYLNLVELAGVWDHRDTDTKIKIASQSYNPLAASVGRGLWASVAEATYMIHAVLAGTHPHEDISPKLSSNRLMELGIAAETLSGMIPSPDLALLLKEAARTTIPTLVAAKRTLEINALPWPEILQHAEKIPSQFDDSALGNSMRGFASELRSKISERLNQSTSELELRIAAAFEEGSISAFTESAGAAIEMSKAAGLDDAHRLRTHVLIDAWVLKYINLAHAAVEHDLSLCERALRADPADTASCASAVDTLNFFVDETSELRRLLSRNTDAIPPARLNHLHLTVAGVFQTYPNAGTAFIEALLAKLAHQDDADDDAARRAGFVALVPGIPNKLSPAGKAALETLRNTIPRT
jgi:hypothetical protein